MAARNATKTESTPEKTDTDTVPEVTDPADQQLATVDTDATADDTDTAEGVVMDDFAVAMARRAAEWINTKGYGPKMTQVIQYIAANALDTAELNSVIMELLAERILNAESAAEVLDPFGTMKAEGLYGKVVWVIDSQFLESDVGEGFPWYVALTIEDPQTHERKVVTVGGEKLVPQAAAFAMRNAWPQSLRIMESEKQTKSGFRVLELRSPV